MAAIAPTKGRNRYVDPLENPAQTRIKKGDDRHHIAISPARNFPARPGPRLGASSLSGLYQRKAAELRDALNGDLETRQQAIAILRTLIDKIVLHPGAKRSEFKVERMGQLASIMNLARPRRPGEEVMITMVAEEGLEPPTRGL